MSRHTLRTDIAVIGGGLGGCAAALAAARLGQRVVLVEETQWVGDQLTNQAVPPDEHPWIEECGATRSYRALRDGIRAWYRAHLPLTDAARARAQLNPGNGWVSRLCHDPRVGVAVLDGFLAPYEIAGRLVALRLYRPIEAWTEGDRVSAVVTQDLRSGHEVVVEAQYFIDATPEGELLPMAGIEHVVGAESQAETGEPHAPAEADPRDQQAITFCFAMEHLPGQNHTIERPAEYEHWRNLRPSGWPGPLFAFTSMKPETHEPLHRGLFDDDSGRSLWTFRRILEARQFKAGFAPSDVTVVNWPQNDFWFGPVCAAERGERERSLASARQLSLSFLYWLQTEAPRADGKAGWPGLRLRGDVVGSTPDGLAAAPYVRDSRRLRAEGTVVEQDIAHPLRRNGPQRFDDSVGIGWYRIDLHPSVSGRGYLDLGCWTFQIPLGALVPVRVDNVLPGGKNLGVSHIANGAFRVHPVEWNVGESAGLLAVFCLAKGVPPRAVRRGRLLAEFQSLLSAQGVELVWPRLGTL